MIYALIVSVVVAGKLQLSRTKLGFRLLDLAMALALALAGFPRPWILSLAQSLFMIRADADAVR